MAWRAQCRSQEWRSGGYLICERRFEFFRRFTGENSAAF